MSPALAALLVAVIALIGNRIVAVFVGVWLHLPTQLLLPLLISLDLIQIPLYYWLYENSATVLARLPSRVGRWFARDRTSSFMGRWTSSLGGLGVMIVAALPTFGGGIWTATFLAYGLKMRKGIGYAWMTLGSVASYAAIYWICGTLVSAIRYFGGR